MTTSIRLSLTHLSGVVLALLAVPAAGQSRLWITDDVNNTIYEIDRSGNLISSLPVPTQGDSGLDVDESNESLWLAREAGASTGSIINYSKAGVVLSTFSAAQYGGITPEGVAVDPSDNSLWIVDDDTLTVNHVDKAGNPISSFLTGSYDPGSVSPQAIEVDPATGSLWITDNVSDRVYNVTKQGALISSFLDADFAGQSINLQGISTDPNGSLWVTGRNTASIYNVTVGGGLISSFSSTTFDPNSSNPTGVALDLDPNPTLGLDLGAAADFATLAMDGTRFVIEGKAKISGDAGLGPNARQAFGEGEIDGKLFVDPSAETSQFHGVSIKGGVIIADLSQAVQDARNASTFASGLPPQQSFGSITEDTSIQGQPGLNVISIDNLIFTKKEKLELRGKKQDRFVLNINHELQLGGKSQIKLKGGLEQENVLINVTSNAPVLIYGKSKTRGTILAPNSTILVTGKSKVDGALIGGGPLLKVDSKSKVKP